MGNIILVDDHTVIREGVKALVEASTSHSVVAQAGDGMSILTLVAEHKPDVIILDLAMPNLNGIEALYRLQDVDHPPAVLVLSSKEDAPSVREAIKAGAAAYVTKSATHEELLTALEAVMSGDHYYSPAVADHLVGDSSDNVNPVYDSLSPREREVMKLLCEGQGNKAVAKLLHLSTRTIDSHRANIMRKLGVNSNAELVQIAIKCGLVEN